MNRKGFTLVEVLGVIVVLALISFLIIPSVGNIIFYSKETAYQTQIETIVNAAKKYGIENSLLFPTENGDKKYIAVSDLVSVGHLSNSDIVNPKTGNLMEGYVQVKYNSQYQQYEYIYIENPEGDIISAMGPTYEVSDSLKWTASKNVTIKFPQGSDYEYEYKILSGIVVYGEQTLELDKWYSSNDLRTLVVFKSQGSLIARVKDGNAYKDGSTLNVEYIDNTAPNTTLGYDLNNSTSNKAELYATCDDTESGIKKYEFSKDGVNWIDNQTNNNYIFNDLNNSTEYTFKVRCTNGSGMTGIGTLDMMTNEIEGPTFIVSDKDVWKTSKNVIILYPENYTKYEFNILEGTAKIDDQQLTNGTWYLVEDLSVTVNFITNGTVAARVYDGTNLKYAENQSVAKVDPTIPSCSIVYGDGILGANGYYKESPVISFSTSVAGPSGLNYGVSKTNTEVYDNFVEGNESASLNITTISEGSNIHYGFVKTGAGNTSLCQNTMLLDTQSPLISLSTDGGNYTAEVGFETIDVTTTVNASDVTSGIDVLKYAWSTSSEIKPNSFITISNGEILTKSLSGGNNYLWIIGIDNASNEKVSVSNNFNVGYRVEYDANGGTTTCSNQRKVDGESLTLCSSTPTRSGYVFVGWSESATATTATYKVSGTYSNDKAVKLYAVWLSSATIPTTSYCNTLTYTGSNQILVKTAGTGYTWATGTTRTSAGSQIVTATLKSGYAWSDGETSSKTITCSISKATPTVTISPTEAWIPSGGKTFVESANVAGSFVNTSDNTSYVIVSSSTANYTGVSANVVKTVSLNSIADGNATVTVVFTPTDTTNYNTVTKKYTAKIDKTKPAITVGIPSVTIASASTSITIPIYVKDGHSGVDGSDILSTSDITVKVGGTAISSFDTKSLSINSSTTTQYTHSLTLNFASNVTSSGAITLVIGENKVYDVAGNGNAATTLSPGITYSSTKPSCTASCSAGIGASFNCSNASEIIYVFANPSTNILPTSSSSTSSSDYNLINSIKSATKYPTGTSYSFNSLYSVPSYWKFYLGAKDSYGNYVTYVKTCSSSS